MTKSLYTFEVLDPIMVKYGAAEDATMVLCTGSIMGLDGMELFVRSHDGAWMPLTTPRWRLAVWLDKKFIRPYNDAKTQILKDIEKAAAEIFAETSQE